jgi:tRNA(fMet)-specific endonuclease VapC
LERAGSMIGSNDLLIASIALANSLTLVTHNVGEFQRVKDLQVADWQTTAPGT